MALTHIAENGEIQMVDVSGKPPLRRTAVAQGSIFLKETTLNLIRKRALKKGDVLACARIAGIMGAKKTSELIPLCHPIPLNNIEITLTFQNGRIDILATVVTVAVTGVEMEALTAVSMSALTIYDMCKAVDKAMRISDIVLVKKEKE